MKIDLNRIATEQRNPDTLQIDQLSTLDMLTLINREDHKVPEAVSHVLPQIASAVDIIVTQMKEGGRLIYVGAGTSGRLGIVDASECPPTFSVAPELVQGLIAGGYQAIFKAVEGAEDDPDACRRDLESIHFSSKDVLCGIAASGRTPYVLGGIAYAHELGAPVIGVTCCEGSAIDQAADIGIAPIPGPEVITGSTRMKSGTCQKLVLNMLSTGTMIRLGKVYGNLMVDVMPSNEKLVRRCIRIVQQATDVSEGTAVHVLTQCNYHCKTAIVMILCDLNADQAASLLTRADGRIAAAVKLHASSTNVVAD